jgi:regulatory protein
MARGGGGRERLLPRPDEASLREAALRYLGRYAATQAGVVRVLDRRIGRWAGQDVGRDADRAELRAVARGVVARLVAAGAIDDAVFAEGRARSLARGGKSRRAISLHLAARGIDPETARAALPADPRHDLRAAVAALRRRRAGPFRADAAAGMDAAERHRTLAYLARRGFAESLARQALGLSAEQAEALLRGPPAPS